MVQTRDQLSIPMHQVDAHNVIPVWEASDKKETAARTIRKKIHTKLPTYLTVPTNSLPSFVLCKHHPLVGGVHFFLTCLVMSLSSTNALADMWTDLQEFPEIPKQRPWKCKRMPDKIDWDGLIAEVLQRGPDVPEVPWFKPGEDAAYDVSSADSSPCQLHLVSFAQKLIHRRLQMMQACLHANRLLFIHFNAEEAVLTDTAGLAGSSQAV